MPRRAARIDSTAKDLTTLARSLGADVMLVNGTIDAVIHFRGRLHVVDFKSKGGTLTPDQAKWVAKGFPIRFVSTPDQLRALLEV